MPVHVIPTSEVPPRPKRVRQEKVVDYLAEEIMREDRKAKHERMKKLVVSLRAKAAATGR